MSFMLRSARGKELKEAIRELARDRNQITRFEQVIRKIIDETICNLNVQTKNDEQASDSMMCFDEEESTSEQYEELPQPFVKDGRENLEDFGDSKLATSWRPHSLQSSKEIRKELNPSFNFNELDLGNETNINIQKSSKAINPRKSQLNTVNKTKSMPSGRRKKMKANLSDENIFIDESTGYEYQIIYKGKAIDKDCLQKITETRTHKTKRGWHLCKIHDKCNFSKPPEIDKSTRERNVFNGNSVRHIKTTLVKFFCRVCHHTFSYSTGSLYHLRRHLRPSPLKSSEGPAGEGDIRKITPKIMQPRPDLSLIDYQGKYRLKLTSHKMHSFTEFDFKYQIYYKGQAIDKSQLKQIMEKKVIKLRSGLFLCPLHEDCPYSREKLSTKDTNLFNRNVLSHTGAAFTTYLCRHCFHKFNNMNSMGKHLRTHCNR